MRQDHHRGQGRGGPFRDLIRLAAFEGTQLYGDSLPLDANRGTGQDKIGFTLRQPCGVVVAITPFNYPALLVLHKLAPALAAGNAVVLKPARSTPLTALALAACFVDAGLPDGVLSVVTGPGGALGDALVTDPRVRKISFTGSTATGERITRVAGVKKLSLELGASCPVVILPDADLELASSAVAAGGYVNAGQVCISVQRVIADQAVVGDFLDALVPKVEAIRTGDPASPDTGMGALITAGEAERVRRPSPTPPPPGPACSPAGTARGRWCSRPWWPTSTRRRPQPGGAVRPGGGRQPGRRLGRGDRPGQRDRLRARVGDLHSDVAGAVQAMREIDSGTIHVNWTPLWRADLMPYGGLKGSGIGKEGPCSAVEEMTEVKTVVLHGRPW